MQVARRGASGELPTWVPRLEQTLMALLVVQSLGSGGATAVSSCMGALEVRAATGWCGSAHARCAGS